MCGTPAHMDAFNSEGNRDGSIIKVLLCTRRGSEGLDMKCIREVHVLEPWYNLNRVEQVVGRAVRNCSHAQLPPAQRNVTVYLHAAAVAGSDTESADLRAYRISLQKQLLITKVLGLLQGVSIEADDASRQAAGRGFPVRLRQQCSQPGCSTIVTVHAPLPAPVSAATPATLPMGGQPLAPGELADSMGVSLEAAVDSLEALARSGRVRRAGDVYVPVGAPVAAPGRAPLGGVGAGPVWVAAGESATSYRQLELQCEAVAARVGQLLPRPLDRYTASITDLCVDAIPSSSELLRVAAHCLGQGHGPVFRSMQEAGVLTADPTCVYDVLARRYMARQAGAAHPSFAEVSPLESDAAARHAAALADAGRSRAMLLERPPCGAVERSTRHGPRFLLRVQTGERLLAPERIKLEALRGLASRLGLRHARAGKRVLVEALQVELRRAGRVLRTAFFDGQHDGEQPRR